METSKHFDPQRKMPVAKIMLVAGARPNFMKIAPILRELDKKNTMQGILVHTGQHYDRSMSHLFFDGLGIREPDYNLEVGSGSHAQQTANVMIRFEEVCLREKPDVVVVVGDVNSTIAAGLVAKKLHVHLAHVEAGLRSGDHDMPEEINRIATDAIADLLFTTERKGTENLLREGHENDSIHFVGHVMIDNLLYQLKKVEENPDEVVSAEVRDLKRALPNRYVCLTLHRPSNVDDPDTLVGLLEAIAELARNVPVIFPCHPRTRKNIARFQLGTRFIEQHDTPANPSSGIILLQPLGYDDFLYLWKDASLVLTDSGGLQEETTALRLPCITMRTSTERPVTAEIGSNEVVGTSKGKIVTLGSRALQGTWKKGNIPELWDGQASHRIVEILQTFLCQA